MHLLNTALFGKIYQANRLGFQKPRMWRIVERNMPVLPDAQQADHWRKPRPFRAIPGALGGQIRGLATQPFKPGRLYEVEQMLGKITAERMRVFGAGSHVFVQV